MEEDLRGGREVIGWEGSGGREGKEEGRRGREERRGGRGREGGWVFVLLRFFRFNLFSLIISFSPS